MKRQLNGIALVLFGLLLCCADNVLNHTIFIDFYLPFTAIGVIIGMIGLTVTLWPERNCKK